MVLTCAVEGSVSGTSVSSSILTITKQVLGRPFKFYTGASSVAYSEERYTLK